MEIRPLLININKNIFSIDIWTAKSWRENKQENMKLLKKFNWLKSNNTNAIIIIILFKFLSRLYF